MSAQAAPRSWQAVRDEVLRRVNSRIWRPGDAIPNEADLAAEFGCSRSTVNRALQSLSEDGLLERRRKGGTRIAQRPVGKATFEIPVIRMEIETKGQDYGYRLLARRMEPAPVEIAAALRREVGMDLLHVISLHCADGRPYVLEDRWIDPATVPEAREVDFAAISANEWLVQHLPFTRADSEITAIAAGAGEAGYLETGPGAALLALRRITWAGDRAITLVAMTYAPGHSIRAGG